MQATVTKKLLNIGVFVEAIAAFIVPNTLKNR
jgi:hypothetical protein